MDRRRFIIKSALTAGAFSFFNFRLLHEQDSRLPLIIDADTANEIDDIFAIVRALKEPSFQVHGITSSQWHSSPQATENTVSESYLWNKKITDALNVDVPVLMGSNIPLTHSFRPQPSPASAFIISMARKMENGNKLNIAILGPCTNIASAILEAPDIASRIRCHYIGLWHGREENTWSKREFNTGNDPIALDVLLNHREVEMHIMTASVSKNLVFDKATSMKYWGNKDPFFEEVMQRWESFDRYWQAEDPENNLWTMWDVAIIEALADPTTAAQGLFETPHDNRSREIYAYTSIDAEKMKENFWASLGK